MDQPETRQLTFLSAERPVSRSLSPDCDREWMTRAATWPSSIAAFLIAIGQDGSHGKMSPASFPLDRVAPETPAQMSLMDLPVTTKTGKAKRKTSHACSMRFSNSGMGSPTEFWTLNSSEHTGLNGLSLKDDGVSSLSDILVTGDLPRRYYLSPKACRGILRRAERRRKVLPEQLRRALLAVAGSEPT